MQIIRCAACGRRYDYRQEGCCPHCGAYNRPPRREWVQADGSVRHAPANSPARPAPGKVCYEEKTCYEEKQCYEEQSRKPRKKKTPQPARQGDRVVRSARKSFPAAGGRKKNMYQTAVIFGVVLLVAVLLTKGLSSMNRWDDDPWTPIENREYSNESVIKGNCGEELQIRENLTLCILGYITDEGRMYLFYQSNDEDATENLLSDAFITLADQEDRYYFSYDLTGVTIEFYTDSPDARWQTLYIETDNGRMIIVDDLILLEEDSAAEILPT